MHDVANHFNLTEEERQQTLPSGKQKMLYNMASHDLLKAGLLEKRQRGIYTITCELSSNHDYLSMVGLTLK
jgi:restriction system protein